MILTKADLGLLLRPESVWHPFRKPRFRIRIPELPESESLAWEGRLENLRQQCGCTAGAIGLGAFVLLSVAYSLHDNSPVDTLGLEAFVLRGAFLAAGLISSALIGKLLGLSVAQVRFRRACFELHKRLLAIEAVDSGPEGGRIRPWNPAS